MPYLQLDTPFKHTAEQKRRLAMRLGEIYSTKMTSNINRLSVRSGSWATAAYGAAATARMIRAPLRC
jgi:hypothetical protein